MTQAIDISALNFQELTDLRGRIDARVQEMRESGRAGAARAFRAGGDRAGSYD